MRFRIPGTKAKTDVFWSVYMWAFRGTPDLLSEKLALRNEDSETVAPWFRKWLIT